MRICKVCGKRKGDVTWVMYSRDGEEGVYCIDCGLPEKRLKKKLKGKIVKGNYPLIAGK